LACGCAAIAAARNSDRVAIIDFKFMAKVLGEEIGVLCIFDDGSECWRKRKGRRI
jgi:hypothetical protein